VLLIVIEFSINEIYVVSLKKSVEDALMNKTRQKVYLRLEEKRRPMRRLAELTVGNGHCHAYDAEQAAVGVGRKTDDQKLNPKRPRPNRVANLIDLI
jgi:hypothetical protein